MATKDPFVAVRILDNFYQTSSFFPMPVVLVSTLSESGQTNLGAYSLCFPHIIAGEHAMMLIARDSSNTAQNLLRTGLCALNFIPDKRKYVKNCVALGFPGETTEEKMAQSVFSLIPSTREPRSDESAAFPQIVEEAIQVFECTWDPSFPVKYEPESLECHFVLRIEEILLKERWRDALFEGRGFPRLPINYGYRNNLHFWFARHRRPYRVPIPKNKGSSIESVLYATSRFDDSVTWQREACAELVSVPRLFLNTVIKGCVEAAKAEGVTEITPEFLERVRDKRSRDKRSRDKR
jgi:flavin reductase (DIM6/NTAB) family NADH-FMN oxidoreductase RutF